MGGSRPLRTSQMDVKVSCNSRGKNTLSGAIFGTKGSSASFKTTGRLGLTPINRAHNGCLKQKHEWAEPQWINSAAAFFQEFLNVFKQDERECALHNNVQKKSSGIYIPKKGSTASTDQGINHACFLRF